MAEFLILRYLSHKDLAQRVALLYQAAGALGGTNKEVLQKLVDILLPDYKYELDKKTEKLLEVFNQYFGKD